MNNTRYPGRPDYTGPKEGFFGFIHHDQLLEYSRNIDERLDYIDRFKPGHQRAWRRHCMVYLGDVLPEKLIKVGSARIKTEDAYNKAEDAYNKAWDAYNKARHTYAPEVLAILTKLVPDHTWDEKELVFDNA